ncbi:MAG: acetyl-CoA carboxylase biotin carboxyl carrier protein [Desulfotignum sp.]
MGKTVHIITSPVMGTFYRASAPDKPPLVEPGQSVKPEDIVCMIESMKIFTEIRCGHTGVVEKILVENEDPVMKNQALMEIELT